MVKAKIPGIGEGEFTDEKDENLAREVGTCYKEEIKSGPFWNRKTDVFYACPDKVVDEKTGQEKTVVRKKKINRG